MSIVKVDFLIIGAGASGLSCGQALKKIHGDLKQILILEGRDRIGGRVHTDYDCFGFGIDLGASWIHGGSKLHPVSQIAKAADLKIIKTDWDSLCVYDADKKITDPELWKTYSLYESLFKKVVKSSSKLSSDRSFLESWLIEEEKLSLSPNQIKLLRVIMSLEIGNENAQKVEALSSKYADAGEDDLSENHYMFVPHRESGTKRGGYSDVLAELAKGLSIRLNEIVVKVDYSILSRNEKQGAANVNQQSIKVTTSNGNVYEAGKVIISVPLGVLKKGVIEFIPRLSAEKDEAIKALGFGSLNKVILSFAESCWPDKHCFCFVNEFGLDFAVNWKKYSGLNVLMVFFVGSANRIGSSDQEIVDKTMSVLRQAFPDIASPLRYKVTRWEEDTFACGSYSSYVVGCEYPKHPFQFHQPEADLVFFAGEHTSLEHVATVHGAIASGVRAAHQASSLQNPKRFSFYD